MKTIAIIPLSLFLLTACEPVHHYNRLNVASFGQTGKIERRPYGTGQVYQKPEDIKRPYTIIGMLSCEGNTGEEAGILNAMLYRAADLGGDGVLLGGQAVAAEATGDPGSHTFNVNLRENAWGAILGKDNSNRRAYRCQVVKFKD